jgi:glycosyltransferase involved in cell wall biosynthesis
MIVGIDINILNRGGGIANYIAQLLDNFKDIEPEYMYKLYFNSFRKIHMPIDDHFFHVTSSRLPDRLLQFSWTYLRFPPIEWFIGDVDVFHSPAHSPKYALSPPAKRWVVTVHDLFTFKLDYSQESREKEMVALRVIERYASKVICVSNSTRNDLLEIIPSLQSKAVVIPEGVDEIFFADKLSIDVLSRYKLKTPYILYVGAADPHKNLQRLIKVFSRLAKKIPHNLVLAGKITDKHKALRDLTLELKIPDRVIFTDSIDADALPSLYKRADLFVLPSLYEGFGLVLLEAMASGTPVVSSNISSIPEVVGNAAQLFNPVDEDDMYDIMYRTITDINRRAAMKANGIDRAHHFSWKKMAQETLQIYKEVVTS